MIRAQHVVLATALLACGDHGDARAVGLALWRHLVTVPR